MSRSLPKSVLLCVSGSIAAYKGAELARLLIKGGCRVRVAMTEAATRFVGPMTFEAITGNPVYMDVFASASGPVDRYGPGSGAGSKGSIEHIEASKQPDLILVAPATADLIGRVAQGFGDDAVTTSILAASAPVVFVPAMNQRMWKNKIVQRNVKTLEDAGYTFLGPDTGGLACGEEGIGRMAEPADVFVHLGGKPKTAASAAAAVLTAPERPDGRAAAPAPAAAAPAAVAAPKRTIDPNRPKVNLKGKKVLIALGRTEETIDPVRYISNRSSGKMGVSVVQNALDAGASVRVVAGPTSVPIPDGVETVSVTTAAEMKKAIHDEFDRCDAFVMVAAVADYKPATEKLHKMDSGEKEVAIDLEPTEDILVSLKSKRKSQAMVGFALETQAEEQRGRKKLQEKGLDLIVVNNPLKEGAGFGSDDNLVSFLHRAGQTQRLALQSKEDIGFEIVRQVEFLLGKPSSKDTPPAPMRPEDNGSGGGGKASGSGSGGSGSAGGRSSRPRSRRRPPRKKTPAGAS